MSPDIQTVIELQSLDIRILALEREVAALPRHVAEIEKALVSHQRKLEADQAALSANHKERRQLEGDVQSFEQKVSRLKDQMLEARTNEQYRAFQHEISFAEEEIRKAEDRILDLMAKSEPLEENVRAAESSLAKEKQQVDREKAEAHRRTDADKAEIERLCAERARVVAGLSTSTYAVYERTRKKYHGQALAEGTDGTCSACHIALRPQFHQDLKLGEELLLCESCGRLLYYNAAVDVVE